MSSDPSRPSRDGPSTNPLLLQKAKAGDQEARNELLRIYNPVVGTWLKNLPDDQVDDIRQETLWAAHQGLNSFEKKTQAQGFRKWLRRITQNKTRDFFRKKSGFAESMITVDIFPELLTTPDWDTNTLEEQRQILPEILEATRREVTPSEWAIFEKIHLEGAKSQEVAADLNLHINKVYAATAKVLAKLREKTKPYLPD